MTALSNMLTSDTTLGLNFTRNPNLQKSKLYLPEVKSSNWNFLLPVTNFLFENSKNRVQTIRKHQQKTELKYLKYFSRNRRSKLIQKTTFLSNSDHQYLWLETFKLNNSFYILSLFDPQNRIVKKIFKNLKRQKSSKNFGPLPVLL